MNGAGRSSREQAEFEKFHYPGTETLRNKLGLRDRRQLELAERYFAARRTKQGFPNTARDLDVDGLRAIHRHLFRDVYEWAGNFGTDTTGRGAAPFATPENIRPWLEKQFAELRDENYLKGLDAGRFAARAADITRSRLTSIRAARPAVGARSDCHFDLLSLRAIPNRALDLK